MLGPALDLGDLDGIAVRVRLVRAADQRVALIE
jgi:hypothetical protein